MMAGGIHHQYAQRGVTLLELMAVVTIISILAMVSTPFYLNYQTKTKVSADILQMAPVKAAATEYFYLEGLWPVSNAQAHAREPEFYKGKYIDSVSITDTPAPGSVQLVYNTTTLPSLSGANVLVFYPQTTDTGKLIIWHCDSSGFVRKLVPKNCKS